MGFLSTALKPAAFLLLGASAVIGGLFSPAKALVSCTNAEICSIQVGESFEVRYSLPLENYIGSPSSDMRIFVKWWATPLENLVIQDLSLDIPGLSVDAIPLLPDTVGTSGITSYLKNTNPASASFTLSANYNAIFYGNDFNPSGLPFSIKGKFASGSGSFSVGVNNGMYIGSTAAYGVNSRQSFNGAILAPASVPGPLPILGLSAFYYARKLKARIKEHKATDSPMGTSKNRKTA